MAQAGSDYDVIILGGGPGGATAAMILARAGHRVCVVEKESHPRFHIGESILPRNMVLLRELGLQDKLKSLPHTVKLGAEFGFGNDPKTMKFQFTDGLLPGLAVFNIERAVFDKMLIDEARAAGADVMEQTAVTRIDRLDKDGAEVLVRSAGDTKDRAIRGKVAIDASGHSTLIGRHMKTRRNFNDPHLQKVAYFEHFQNVERLAGEQAGHPSVIMAEEGWFWLIALNETTSSVGFVTRPSFTRDLGVAPGRLLRWAITRCPIVRERMKRATGPIENRVLADFSYTCTPFAGPGYFLVGDAGCFLDPIFSTGVTLAMVGAQEAARLVHEMLSGRMKASVAQRRFAQFIDGSTAVFWRLIRGFYRQSFRELFMEGQGPLSVHRAVISTLAGQVFPRPAWALRWRLRMFDIDVWLQQYLALAPRRAPFFLQQEPPIEWVAAPSPVAT